MGRHMLLSHWPFFPQSKKKLRGVELNCLYCFADTGPLMLMVGNPEKEPKIKWAYKKRTANKQWTVTFTYFDNFDHFFFSCQDGEKMEFWFLSFFGHQDQSFDVSPSAFYSFFANFWGGEELGKTTTLSSFYSLVTDVDSTKNFSSEGKHISIWFKWKVIRSEGKNTTSTQ